MKKRTLLSLLYAAFLLLSVPTYAGNGLPIIPKPLNVTTSGEYISMNKSLTIYVSPKVGLNEAFVRSLFAEIGVQTVFVKAKRKAQLTLKTGKCFSKNSEAYTLSVNQKGKMKAEANTKNGLIYSLESLRQIIQNHNGQYQVPCCNIQDEPAFPWRAYMQDESRHFQGMETVKKLLDEMTRLKLNTFHWHLVDDQGWRIEIKKYPLLTSRGSKRDYSNWVTPEEWNQKYPDRKTYYTQDEIREIVLYAANRGIKVIPEIEIPGHSSAAILSYPWLGTSNIYNVTNPKVETFFHDVLMKSSIFSHQRLFISVAMKQIIQSGKTIRRSFSL